LRRDVSQDLDDHFEILIDANIIDVAGTYLRSIRWALQVDGLIVEEQGSVLARILIRDGMAFGRPTRTSRPMDGSQP